MPISRFFVYLPILLLAMFCAVPPSIAQNQTSMTDSLYIRRLENVCKVWGYLKYFHSGINRESAWDDVLVKTIADVKLAQSQAEYLAAMDRLIVSAGNVTTATVPAPTVPRELRLRVDYSWMNNRQMLSSESIAALEKVQQNFRPFLSYYIEPSPVGTPQARNEDPYPSMTYPNEPYRLLALFRHWNIINYFYPYKDTIGRPWEAVLPELIPTFIGAKNSMEYYAAVRHMSSQINDSHGFVNSGLFASFFGSASLPVEFRYVQGQTVVFKIPYRQDWLESIGFGSVRPGDVLLSIGGISVDTLRKRLQPIVPASNISALNRDINSYLRFGDVAIIDLVFRRGAQEFTMRMTRPSSSSASTNFVKDESQPWKIMDNNIGYVDMGRLQRADVAKMMQELMNTRGIVFDIRNYPNGTMYDIGAYLTAPVPFVRFTSVNPSSPGVFLPGVSSTRGEITPLTEPYFIGKSKAYQGKTVALIDQETQSHAEFTTMSFRAAGAKIIGSQTAGADGNVVPVRLPGDVLLYYTSLGVFYPDGKATQRIGIVPDIQFRPTVDGIRVGRDEVLERGIKEILGTTLMPSECTLELQAAISPNPVAETVQIEFVLRNDESLSIRLFNVIGQCVWQSAFTGKMGKNVTTVNVSSLASGLYYCSIVSPSASCQTAIPIIKSR